MIAPMQFMKHYKFTIPTLAAVLLLAGVSSLTAGLTGAIFTTNSTGTVVNGNQYDSPCSVYLDGGPGLHAPAHAAGLPNGPYYFQVTDPSGKTLLSTDPVANRSFLVSGGVIVAYSGDGTHPIHVTGPDLVHPELGAVTIRLANLSCPADFSASPNNGGAYKVWVTPVGSYISDANNCGNGCFHGFIASASKTDNFKVNTATATFCLTVQKLFLQSDGVTLVPQSGWEFDVTDPQGVMNQFFTDTTGQVVVCDLTPGYYSAAEIIPPAVPPTPPTVVVGLIVNNQAVTPPTTGTSFTWAVGGPAVGIVFINQVQVAPPPPPPV
jgi:hypothetical protein